MDVIDILVYEHTLIQQFLDNLSMAAEKLEAGERPPREFFEKAIEFARNFTDKFHHFKEEHVIFAQLAQRKDGVLDGQIDSLRHQHERGRNHIIEISDSLDGYARGNEIHTSTLLENLSAYISLLRRHIHEEEDNFYKIVKKEFSENELEGILEVFYKEDKRTGGNTFVNSQNLAQEMDSLL